jgi:hypothetical protein
MTSNEKYIVNNIPPNIEKNIDEITGYNDRSVPFESWVEAERQLLADYGCELSDAGYEFESEAHYTWLILKFS